MVTKTLIASCYPPWDFGLWKSINFASPECRTVAARGGVNKIDGGRSLQITYPVNEAQGGVSVTPKFSKEVWISFCLCFEDPFDFPQGLKIFRISSFNEDEQKNNWDAILCACARKEASGQAGVTTMHTLEASRNGGDFWGECGFTFVPGRNYQVTLFFGKSTEGIKDGRFAVKIDDETILDLRGIDCIRPGKEGPINRLHFGGWYSNSAGGNPHRDPATPAKLTISNARYFGY